MKIKVIDLLVKMANNEKIPKKIKFNGNIYEYKWSNAWQESCYINDDKYRLWEDVYLDRDLNEEIEIIEEEIKAVNKGLRKVRERAFKNKYKSLDLQKENQELKEFMSSLLNNNGYKFKNGNGEIVFGLDNDVKRLEREIEELTKQLEEKENCINKLQASKNKLNKWNYEDTMKQKEFIKYLENEYTKIQTDIENEIDNNIKYFKIERRQAITGILQKYKEIVEIK